MPAAPRQPEPAGAAPEPILAPFAFEASALAQFTPPPKIHFADWIEANIVLPADVSDTPGPMRLTAPQRGLCEAFDDPDSDRIVFVKPVRWGATTLMVALLGAYVANDPANTMMVQPTLDDARDVMVSTVDPIFQASPSLRAALTQDEKRRDLITARRFTGGSLKSVSAHPRMLRRHQIRILLMDECDAYEPAPGEGSPIKLAERRTLAARNRLIFMASTPTDAETSNIMKAYRESDQRVYELQCPHCSVWFEPTWSCIKWDKAPTGEHLPETAYMAAPCCGGVIEESSKARLVENGRWRATAPHVKGCAGFKTSALISTLPHASWAAIVREFLASKDDVDLLRVWTNTLMGEPFHDLGGEGLDEHALARRAEPFDLESNIPEDVRILTVGIDVQGYGVEALTIGHSATQMFILDYRTIHGAPTGNQVWLDLDAFLRRRFPHPLGGSLGFDAVAIDSGDGNVTDIVYGFTKPRFGSRRVVSVKGHDGNRPLIERSSKAGLYIVGVDGAKSRLFGLLEAEGHVRFSQSLPARFYEELCSERRVVFYKFGQPRKRWERIKGMRAEALDAACYAMAVRGLVGVDLTVRENTLRGLSTSQAPTVWRSKFMDRGRE